LFTQATSTKKTHGFTIVELLVVTAVLMLLIGLVMSTLGDFYQANTTSLQQTVQNTDTRSVLRTIENDLINSSGFLTKNSMAIVSPTGPNDSANNNDWDYKGNTTTETEKHRVLIASKYATYTATTDDNRVLVYQNSGSCDPTVAAPVKNNLVYFTKLDTATNKYNLYGRTMVGTGPYCNSYTPTQKQSCKAGTVLTTPCQAVDAVLLYDIDSFSVEYYASASEQTPIDGYPPGTGDISTAKSIKIKITTKRLLNGVSTPLETDIRVSPLNI